MARRELIVFECDLCKKEVEREANLRKIRLPYREKINNKHTNYFMEDYDADEKYNIVDCCDDCSFKLAKLIADNFGCYDIEEDKLEVK